MLPEGLQSSIRVADKQVLVCVSAALVAAVVWLSSMLPAQHCLATQGSAVARLQAWVFADLRIISLLGLAVIGRFCGHSGEVAASVATYWWGVHAFLRARRTTKALQVFWSLHSKQPPCLSTQSNGHVHQNLKACFRAAPCIVCHLHRQLPTGERSSQRQQLPTRHPKV